MIDAVYYGGGPMKAETKPACTESEQQRDWDPRYHPAVRELLDHVAHQLAEEYVRLIKQAATEDQR